MDFVDFGFHSHIRIRSSNLSLMSSLTRRWFLLPIIFLFYLLIQYQHTAYASPFSHLTLKTSAITSATSLTARGSGSVILLNTCTRQGSYFDWSYCVRYSGPRAYRLSCSEYIWDRASRKYVRDLNSVLAPIRDCPENYICVNGPQTAQGHLQSAQPQYPYIEGWAMTAYCLHIQSFVRLAELKTGETFPKEFAASYLEPGNAESGAVEAIVTDSNGAAAKCINVSSISISAQASYDLGGIRSWSDTLGGRETCGSCASAGIVDVPASARRIDIKVSLGEGQPNALLYLASVFS